MMTEDNATIATSMMDLVGFTASASLFLTSLPLLRRWCQKTARWWCRQAFGVFTAAIHLWPELYSLPISCVWVNRFTSDGRGEEEEGRQSISRVNFLESTLIVVLAGRMTTRPHRVRGDPRHFLWTCRALFFHSMFSYAQFLACDF